jgi:hypothetical protein
MESPNAHQTQAFINLALATKLLSVFLWIIAHIRGKYK